MCYSESDPVKLVSGIKIDRRTVGPKSAQEVHAACCTLQDGSIVGSHSNPPRVKAAAAAAKKPAAKPPRQPAQSDSASITLPKKNSAVSSLSSSSSVAGKRRVGDSSPIALDSPSPPKKQKAEAAAKGSCPSLTTPKDVVAAVRTCGNDGEMLDPAGWSTDTASTKQAASTARGKENNNYILPQRTIAQTLPASRLNDSCLFSSPDNSTPGMKPSPREKRATECAKPKAGGNIKAATACIDLLDSDTDDDSEERYKNDLSKAIQASLSDTPSTTSTVSTPAIPRGKANAGRKVSDESNTKRRPSQEADDYLLLSSPEETSLRERLARKMGKEVIEILDD
jgi:hypothetical protein